MELLQLIIYFALGIIIPVSFLWSFLLISFFGAAPYVPTSQKIIEEILASAKLKNGQKFFDLGSGDGRVVITAVKKYQVSGTGVEINPYLYWYSKIISWIKGLKKIRFLRKDLMKVNLSEANIIFLYLLPKFLPKLKEKLALECKKNTLIISHRFAIIGWENKMVKVDKRPHCSTYYYLI